MVGSTEYQSAPPKLLTGRAVKIKVAIASALVLVVGAWLAPRAAETPLSAPQERAAPLLEEQAQQREVSRPFLGLQDVAAAAREHSVGVLAPPAPVLPGQNDYAEPQGQPQSLGGFGVLISDSQVLTHSRALGGRSYVDLALGRGLGLGARVVAYERSTGLVLLQIDGAAGRAPAAVATEAPAPGALAVAVGRSDQRTVAVPVFVTTLDGDQYRLGGADAVLPGMPVFNPSGELFAVAAPGDGEVRAIPVWQAVDRMVARAVSGDGESAFGLGFQAIIGGLSELYGPDGVLVTEVLAGGPAGVAGVQPGDVLLAVGDLPTDSPEAAARALGSAAIGVETALRVRRGVRVEAFGVTAASAYEVAALGRSVVDPAAGPEARTLFPATVLQQSAIPPSARVVSVNGRSLTSRTQVLRELRVARRAVPVLVREGAQQFFAVVEPTR